MSCARAPFAGRRQALPPDPAASVRPARGRPLCGRSSIAERPDLVEICDKYALAVFRGLDAEAAPAASGAGRALTCERMDDNVRAFVSDSPMAARLAARYIRDRLHAAIRRAHRQFRLHRRRSWRIIHGIRVRSTSGTWASTPSPSRRPAAIGRAANGAARELGYSVRARRCCVYAGRLSAEKHAGAADRHDARAARGRARTWSSRVADRCGATLRSARRRGMSRARCTSSTPLPTAAALADLFTDGDLFVHPNPREPFGIAPLEAMAAGLPVVAPDRGGVTSYANADQRVARRA